VTIKGEAIDGTPFGHAHCFLCGDKNPGSLGLRFYPEGEQGVQAQFQAFPELQGYESLVHGGILSALLDAAMTHCLFRHQLRALTAELTVRFLAPVPMGALLRVRAWPLRLKPPLFCLQAELSLENGETILARAEGKFMRFPDQGARL